MFSWSFKWLWAQCLVVSAGLFLLGHMAAPAAKDLTPIKGIVEHVGLISRKGLGGFYELTVKTADGGQDRVLIGRDAAPEQTMRALVGRKINAAVNWSSEAVQFDSEGGRGNIAEAVRTSVLQRSNGFTITGAIALGIGMLLGLATLILHRRGMLD